MKILHNFILFLFITLSFSLKGQIVPQTNENNQLKKPKFSSTDKLEFKLEKPKFTLTSSTTTANYIMFSSGEILICPSLFYDNDRIKQITCGSQTIDITNIKLLFLNGSYFISNKRKPNKSFTEVEVYDVSGPIKTYYNETYGTYTYYNPNRLNPYQSGSSGGTYYYYYIKGEDMMFNNLKMKNIMSTLEKSKACDDIVKKLYRKRRTSNIYLITAGLSFISAGYLVSEAIRTDEFNPIGAVLAGTGMINIWIGARKKSNIRQNILPDAVSIYNSSL